MSPIFAKMSLAPPLTRLALSPEIFFTFRLSTFRVDFFVPFLAISFTPFDSAILALLRPLLRHVAIYSSRFPAKGARGPESRVFSA